MTYELEVSGSVIRTASNASELREWATINGVNHWEIYATGVPAKVTYNSGGEINMTYCEIEGIKKMRAEGAIIESICKVYGYSHTKVYQILKDGVHQFILNRIK